MTTIKPSSNVTSAIARRKNVSFVSIEPTDGISKLSFSDGVKVIKKKVAVGSYGFINYSSNKMNHINKIELLVFNDGENIWADFSERNSNNPNWQVLPENKDGFFIVYHKKDVFSGELEYINPDSTYPEEILKKFRKLSFNNLIRTINQPL